MIPDEQTIAQAFTKFLEVTKFLSDPEAGLATPTGKVLLAGGISTARYMFISGARLTVHDMAILRMVTGANPIPHNMRGNVAEMEDIWRTWARDHLNI